ncbi:MAG: serine hydrolase domain-containing protein, partial [Planctomycetota bacterium]
MFVCLLAEFCFAAQFEFRGAPPESQGLSAERLKILTESLGAKNTKALLVVRNDRIVCEWYAKGHGPDKRHYTASLAKALVGGMSLLVALNDGLVAVDDPACKYVPQWKAHPVKSTITIRHLATHSSGIEDAEQDDIPHMELPGWKGGFWRRDPDPFTLSRDEAPIIFAPGTEYSYSNPGMAMLSYAVTASLRRAEHTDVRTLLRERILEPIGVKDSEWSIGY